MARVDLTAAAQYCKITVAADRLRVWQMPGKKQLPAQFVPDEGAPASGTILFCCDPAPPPVRVWLDFTAAPEAQPISSTTVTTRWYTVKHDPARMGGLPSEIVFAGTGGKFDSLYWSDRLYHRQDGQFWLRYDRQPQVRCISSGPLCTVVRVAAAYSQPDGKRPESRPAAVYDWYYFVDSPLIHVRGAVRQREMRTWHEAHFLELGFPTNRFPRWAGGEPRQEGDFRGNDESHRLNRWGAVMEGREVIGMFDAGTVNIHDGRGYGRYLHAQTDAAWQEWKTTAFERSAWLRIAADDAPAQALAALSASVPHTSEVSVSIERLQLRLDALRAQIAQAEGPARRALGWQLVLARLGEKHHRFREALELPPGQLPEGWSVVPAGDLRLVLERRSDGLALLDLADAASGSLLAGPDALPLFEVTLRNATNREEIRLTADRDWSEVTMDKGPGENTFTLQWKNPRNAALGALVVKARLRADASRHRLSWSLDAQGQAQPWSLWQVRFPQLSLVVGSAQSQLLLPQAAGVLRPVGRDPLPSFHGDYPSGWMAMQLAALCEPPPGVGLYFGLHDPVGSTKSLTAENTGGARAVRLAWDIPAPGMGLPGNRFALSGEAVWQLLRGDWFDAAVIYRDWARAEAKWFPPLTADGRTDTPSWMRELCAWAMTGGPIDESATRVLEFAQALGVPAGFHWYNWHQIPFDNDYPHYLPPKKGFVEGVRRLQAGNVYVMPYINGRLWDTHDQGTNDFEFTRVARPAATKDVQGNPIIESYGSKEANGQDVRLAVMCPTTPTWRERQYEIVTRLFTNCGVKAVYIDQIAAAKSELCFDPAHGHLLGGGAWWTEQGYWPMLDSIRAGMPRDRMLTTECNAEPFLRWFDGYLTWHWQYDGQVPLFPAVYGGAIQMFGRAYRGGPTKDLALRMKAGQQLVYGEQLGWLEPSVTREPENFAFFRDAVMLRWNLRRYFYAGQMARPPALAGDIPNVTADWQWSGVWPVTTPALMGGAWHLPSEKRLVLLFANVSEQAITATVRYDLKEAGLAGPAYERRKWTPSGESDSGKAKAAAAINEAVSFPPRSVWAWEFEGRE